METETFDIIIINLNTNEHPIYKAVSISGYGSGYGNSYAECRNDVYLQIKRLLTIMKRLNMEIHHKKLSDFRSENIPGLYGLSSWDSDSVIWDSIDISTDDTF